MTAKPNLRIELKFKIPRLYIETLHKDLHRFYTPDINNKNETGYKVSSLYFDDHKFKCFHEKNAGDQKRFKYRIRCYNNDFKNISLERKIKRGKIYSKKIEKINLPQDFCWETSEAQLQDSEFYRNLKQFQMKPKCWIHYNRFAYTDTFHRNIRITIDDHIQYQHEKTRYTKDHTHQFSIVEIKYGSHMPNKLSFLINQLTTFQSSFSKYQNAIQHLYHWENYGLK